jgi:hypothetical protein
LEEGYSKNEKYMQQKFLFFFIITLLLVCCRKKNESHRKIDGSWYMYFVEDKSVSSKPQKPSNSADVIISFVSKTDTTGTFSGSTPSNQILSNNYFILPNDHLKITTLAMTNAPETQWGQLFVNEIRNAETFGFEEDIVLSIHTSSNKRIWFKKL